MAKDNREYPREWRIKNKDRADEYNRNRRTAMDNNESNSSALIEVLSRSNAQLVKGFISSIFCKLKELEDIEEKLEDLASFGMDNYIIVTKKNVWVILGAISSARAIAAAGVEALSDKEGR